MDSGRGFYTLPDSMHICISSVFVKTLTEKKEKTTKTCLVKNPSSSGIIRCKRSVLERNMKSGNMHILFLKVLKIPVSKNPCDYILFPLMSALHVFVRSVHTV